MFYFDIVTFNGACFGLIQFFSDTMRLSNHMQKKNTIFLGWDKLTQDRKKRMSKKYKFYIHIYIYMHTHTHTHLGMSQHEVSFFGSKTVALRGKKDTSFWDTPTHTYIYEIYVSKTMFCNNGLLPGVQSQHRTKQQYITHKQRNNVQKNNLHQKLE